MTKHQLALKISRRIYRGKCIKQRFNAYQLIQRYLANLSNDDLALIARKYTIDLG